MGESNVKLAKTSKQLQIFEKHLLNDIHALEQMLNEGMFEIDVTRIGAEQEFCLVDQFWKPSPRNVEVLKMLDNEMFTSELAKFNLEANCDPLEFSGDCLTVMEDQISGLLDEASVKANQIGNEIVLAGILPTIRKYDLGTHNITPEGRYYALCEAINMLRGKIYELRINGIDELIVKHDSPLLEGANTGFQVHLQVQPDEFVKMYNIAQAITGPVLAAATFSPVLFMKRLWQETRVALFTQTVDTRTTSDHLREASPRVTFGNDWLHKSILEIYKEDIMRYRVMLSSQITENVSEKLKSGTAPDLMALKVHNGTVYRWNRPCYGSVNGIAHLRIENRVLPSGPSVLDEMANAALWLGLMIAYKDELDDVKDRMQFSDARANFLRASRYGLGATFNWFDKKRINATDLLLNELIPMARKGLKKRKVKEEDIERYMKVLEDRVSSGKDGSNWLLDSYDELKDKASNEEVYSAITASMSVNQKENKPVHTWDLAKLEHMIHWEPSTLIVEECMTKDLFTVQQDDILQLVAQMMDWQKIRFVAVENKKGKLVGLITSRLLLREYSAIINNGKEPNKTVKDVMIKDPLTVSPDMKVYDAMKIMQEHQIGSIPVVQNKRLVGMLTEQNFLMITNRLLTRLKDKREE